MRHGNIVRFIHASEEGPTIFIVMALAVGGELFDRIEPDRGMPGNVAHFYFRQLISAVVRTSHCYFFE